MPPENHTRVTVKVMCECAEKAHGIMADVARACNVSRKTVTMWAKKYPTFKEAIDQARDRLIDVTENRLYAMINDPKHPMHAQAVFFALKCLAKDRGYVERQEVDLKDKRVEIEAPDDFPKDEPPDQRDA